MNGFSIVICCYNSALRLPATLNHIALLDGLDRISTEIIIINNCSTDDTADVAVNEWKKNMHLNIKLNVVNESTPGLGPARKKGIQSAKFEYLIFCDDDNWLNHDFLNVALKIMSENPKTAVVGGLGSPYFEKGEKPDWFDDNQGFYAVGKQAESDGPVPKIRSYVFGAASVWRTSVLKQIMQTPLLVADRVKNKLSSSGDNEMCYKAILLGYQVFYSAHLKFTHFIPQSRLSLAYIKKLNEDSVPGAIHLHGLAYKIGINEDSFGSYAKRTWWGQCFATLKHYLTGRTHNAKIVMLGLKELIKLNWKYDSLFK
jgi:glycosyltransferase involved in cell wall biosynthesis